MSDHSKEKSLPWWVELLFVQIGLPDNWLRSFLKKRKRLRTVINDNNRFISITALTAIFMVYYNPIRREAILQNECISSSIDIIRSIREDSIEIEEKQLRSYAMNFCNGGSI